MRLYILIANIQIIYNIYKSLFHFINMAKSYYIEYNKIHAEIIR
jgi:hypothetical protein